MTIDLNCDMGESYGRYEIGNDAEIMPLISSCNIACGFHGGDPDVIIQTIKLASKHGVKIGAHPSYPDRQGFGRRQMSIKPSELTSILIYQIAVIDKLSSIYSSGMHHVKPHGALYNLAYSDEKTVWSIVSAMENWKDTAVLYAQFGSLLHQVASNSGINVVCEGFVDRKYDETLNLVSRTEPGAVHQNISTMVDQTIAMIKYKTIETSEGPKGIDVQTLCIHGDHPQAAEITKVISTALKNEGITIQ